MASKYKRGRARRLPRKRIFVFVEGRATESDYFTKLRNRLRIPKELVPVVCPSYTDMGSILDACIKDRKKALDRREAEGTDQWWVVADTEGREIPRELVDKARKNRIFLCASGPCFEFWLLLHFRYSTRSYNDANAVATALEELMPGYRASGKHPDMDALFPRIPDAVRNGSRLRAEGGGAETANSCTDCDLLVSEINAQAANGCELMRRCESDPHDLYAFRR